MSSKQILQVDCQSILLTGITLNAHFTIANTHQILAVMFEVKCDPPFLQIEPERGMVLQKQSKFIKVRIKPQLRKKSDQFESTVNKVIINCTYFSEYNKKIMKQLDLRGWSKISKIYQTREIPVSISVEVQKLKSSIKRGDSLSNSVSSRKINSFQKFKQSSIKKVNSPALNSDLDFIFRNDALNLIKNQEEKYKKQISQLSNQQLFLQFGSEPPSSPLKLKTAKNNKQEGQAQQAQRANPPVTGQMNRSVELIILAVLAAIFVALGQSIGKMFS